MSTATLAGNRCTSVTIRVPSVGAWVADCELDTAADITGEVVLDVAGLEFTGTADPFRTGSFGGMTRARVVAGAGAWGATLAARAYHNDLGVSLATVVGDLAREAGEDLLGILVGVPSRLDVDFVRQSGPASRSLRQAIGTAAWWVDYDGQTHVAPRVQSEITGTYQLLRFDPRTRQASIALDDPAAIVIGSVLRDTALPYAVEVEELEIVVSSGTLRVNVWGAQA